MSEQPPQPPQDWRPPVDPRWGPPSGGTDAGGAPSGPPDYPPPRPVYGQPPASWQPVSGAGDPRTAHGQAQYGQAAYGEVISAGRPRSRRGLALGGGALALALAAGGGLYFATAADDAAGQPEDLVPATAAAFAKVDLDPAAEQKVAISEFGSKFPKRPNATAQDPVDGLLRTAFDGETAGCDYETVVKPWLGKRVAIAAIPAGKGKTVPLVLLQLKEGAAAKAALEKLHAGSCAEGGKAAADMDGLTVKDGYAVMGETQADVDKALADAAEKSLADAPGYADDMATLDGNQIVTVWVDVARTFDAAATQQRKLNSIPTGIAKQFTGRIVAGLHMENDYVEVAGRVLGSDLTDMHVAAPTQLERLPATTVAAVSVMGLQDSIEKQLLQAGTGTDVDSALREAGNQLGVDIRKELLPLLGNATTLSLGNIPTGGPDAKFGLQAALTDPAGAKKAGDKLAAIAAAAGVELDVAVEDEMLYLTTKGYAAELRADGGLAASPVFVKAMGPLGNDVSGAAFVDIGQLAQLAPGGGGESVAPLSAFGMSAGKDGDDGYFRVRLVVK